MTAKLVWCLGDDSATRWQCWRRLATALPWRRVQLL